MLLLFIQFIIAVLALIVSVVSIAVIVSLSWPIIFPEEKEESEEIRLLRELIMKDKLILEAQELKRKIHSKTNTSQ